MNQDKWISIIYEDKMFKAEIESYLDNGSKINAIKCFKLKCEEKSKVSLRICKDTIDIFANRLNVTKKMEHLRDTIEIFCNANGYDKMENYKVRKAKDSHKDVWVYSDWEFVDDMYGNMINSQSWMPAAKTLRDMNEIYKKYK